VGDPRFEDFDVDEMFDDLLTVSEASTIYHVTAHQLKHWRHRGHLTPAARDRRGRPLFLGIDVLRALGEAEGNAERTQADNLATRRATRAP
jgi:hypothetical protein